MLLKVNTPLCVKNCAKAEFYSRSNFTALKITNSNIMSQLIRKQCS